MPISQSGRCLFCNISPKSKYEIKIRQVFPWFDALFVMFVCIQRLLDPNH